MEGTEPSTPPPAAPKSSLALRRSWFPLVLIIAVVVIAAVVSVYVLTPPPPIPLAVHDGSTRVVIEGNLTNSSPSVKPLLRYINATSYGNQSQGTSSTVSLELVVSGGFLRDSLSDPWVGEWLMHVTMTAVGRFATNTHPSGLSLTCNGTSANVHVDSEDSYLTGTNVSFRSNQIAYFIDNGSAAVVATPVTQGQSGPYYSFSFSDTWRIDEYLSYNGSYGFRATVGGPFTPAVSVAIILAIIDVPA